MRHLTILVPDTQTGPNTLSCIIGAYHIFTEANTYYARHHTKSMFKIELAGVSVQSDFVNGLLKVMPQTRIEDLHSTDLIIIPAITAAFKIPEASNVELVDWIVQQYHKGAEVASMCTGAYLLAATGLLDHKSCSIHWNAAANFKRLFPQVVLKAEMLITDEQGIYTNGGGYSFLNLLLYLVEKYYNRETAIYCSKIFQIDMDRQTQSNFVIFRGQKSHGDEVVIMAQEYMENNFSGKTSIEELSKKLSVGRRSFDRRFIKATGNTPIEYWQRVRIESAKRELETSRKTVNEIMYEVGYVDVRAFREVFRKFTGVSPIEYKVKYNNQL